MVEKVNKAEIDAIVREMAFGQDNKSKQLQLREMAKERGIYPASIQKLYEAIGKGSYRGFTVPAINIRGITYDVAQAAFRAAIRDKVGPLIFEIARTEIAYTVQSPAEYACALMAAAMVAGYKGPLFIQGDHFQVNAKNYRADSQKELNAIKALIKEAIEAGFYNIDIDASTMVDISKKELADQQELNGALTAQFTEYIRGIQPAGIMVSIGGEIGEIGTGNSTVGDLEAFMARYQKALKPGTTGISKISVQTGTTHGGVALPDGSIAEVQLDFDTLEKMSRVAREKYGLGGAVQHGASTLPDEMFHIFPEKGTLEVHLATGFQNMIFDSKYFPHSMLEKIQAGIDAKYAADKKSGETSAQFYYRNRKRSFGDFKKALWDLPEDTLQKIAGELEDRFSFLYHKLNVQDTREIIDKVIQ